MARMSGGGLHNWFGRFGSFFSLLSGAHLPHGGYMSSKAGCLDTCRVFLQASARESEPFDAERVRMGVSMRVCIGV